MPVTLTIPHEVAIDIADRALAELAVADIEHSDNPRVAYYWIGRLEAALRVTLMALKPGPQ